MLATQPALLLAILSILATAASAQAERPSPPTTMPAFRSALEGYRPFADEQPAPWRASNDTVGRIGGWRAYAREAAPGGGADPAAAPAAPTASGTRPATPAANPHGGHKH